MTRAMTLIDGESVFTNVSTIIQDSGNPYKRLVAVINNATGDTVTYNYPQLTNLISELIAARNIIRVNEPQHAKTENTMPRLRDTDNSDEVPEVPPFAYWESLINGERV